ncbi:Haem-degrading [Natribacillus halophilus]|uniref:Haem-degrading n=1 Tax=Natribacillus halophilus TaxID=549003 RepID=A0A1G8RAI3_9BACI|nr:Haem-degrading [Natribacillus halophilus]
MKLQKSGFKWLFLFSTKVGISLPHTVWMMRLASIDIAQNKAWMSVALKMPTSNLEEETTPDGSLYGLNTTNQGHIVVFGGGICE